MIVRIGLMDADEKFMAENNLEKAVDEFIDRNGKVIEGFFDNYKTALSAAVEAVGTDEDISDFKSDEEEYQIKEYHADLKNVFIHFLCLEYVFKGRHSVTDSEQFVECIRKKDPAYAEYLTEMLSFSATIVEGALILTKVPKFKQRTE